MAESEFLPVINLSGINENLQDRFHESLQDKQKIISNKKIPKSDVLKMNLPDINEGKFKTFV